MSNHGKLRILLVLCLFTAVLSIYSWRLIDLQVVQHEKYAAMAERKHVAEQTIPASRGSIYDSHGEILAGNVPVCSIIADASQVNDREQLEQVLARHLKLSRSKIAERLATGRKHIVLKHKVPESEADELADELRLRKLKGIRFENKEIRIYPNEDMLAHVIGYINHEMKGVAGIERSMNNYLGGRDGYRFIEHDRYGREIVLYRGQERQPVDGCDVNLTIDMGLQQIIEEELDSLVEKYSPVSATIILMDPMDGAILALANRPHFSPHRIGQSPTSAMKNHAVASMVEPGSTFKIVAAGAALNERLVEPSTIIHCENGRFYFGGLTLNDHHPYGDLTVEHILMKSSNIGAAKLAIQLGEQKFHEYVRRFGFGEASGIDLPGEIPGVVHPVHKWSRISITRIPMGHEIAVTPVQVLAAMAVIANGGVLVRPHVVKSITDGHGQLMSENSVEVRRRVISRDAARKVSLALEGVVSESGTAKQAAVEGFRVAGKTGTAQRVDPAGGYADGRYVVSFVGYLPAEDPVYVGLVLVDDPKTEPGMSYGSTVAAPVFAAIGERAVRYYDLEPNIPPMEFSPAQLTLLEQNPEGDVR